jgi:hypothetical protein
MRPTLSLVVALGVLLAIPAGAQDAPPALELPRGARVRLQTHATPGRWIEGVLASADAATISVVPEEAPPLGANQLRLPSEVVDRLEIVTARKRQWLPGLLVGAALGLAIGLTEDIDPVQCELDDSSFCSRGAAVAAMGGTTAALGAVVGSLFKRDVWTPVALDALGPPAPRTPRPGLQFQAVPGGLALGLSVRF